MAMRAAAAPVTRTGRVVASSLVHLCVPTPPPAQSQLPTNRAFPARIAPSRPSILTHTPGLPSSLGLADSLVEMEEHTKIEMLKKIKADVAKEFLMMDAKLKTLQKMLGKHPESSEDKMINLLSTLGMISRICIVVCLGYLWSKSD